MSAFKAGDIVTFKLGATNSPFFPNMLVTHIDEYRVYVTHFLETGELLNTSYRKDSVRSLCKGPLPKILKVYDPRVKGNLLRE